MWSLADQHEVQVDPKSVNIQEFINELERVEFLPLEFFETFRILERQHSVAVSEKAPSQKEILEFDGKVEQFSQAIFSVVVINDD